MLSHFPSFINLSNSSLPERVLFNETPSCMIRIPCSLNCIVALQCRYKLSFLDVSAIEIRRMFFASQPRHKKSYRPCSVKHFPIRAAKKDKTEQRASALSGSLLLYDIGVLRVTLLFRTPDRICGGCVIWKGWPRFLGKDKPGPSSKLRVAELPISIISPLNWSKFKICTHILSANRLLLLCTYLQFV